jgi:hypothetical protein
MKLQPSYSNAGTVETQPPEPDLNVQVGCRVTPTKRPPDSFMDDADLGLSSDNNSKQPVKDSDTKRPARKKSIKIDTGHDYPGGLRTYNQLIQMLDLKWVCPNMAWCWLLQWMRYKYDKNCCSYYTNGHEQADTMTNCNNHFLVEYFKLERSAHCWVQLTEEKANELEETLSKPQLQKNVSYNYTTPDGV